MLQPSTELQLPFVRTLGSASLTALGLAIPALNVTAAALGGMYIQPFKVPADYDRSRLARLFAYIGTAALGGAAGNVQLDAVLSTGDVGAVVANTASTQLVAIAAAWPANSWVEVEIGNLVTGFIPAGTLAVNSILGIRLARNGPAAGDTWPSTLAIIQSLRLRYSRLCQHCDSCS